MTLNSLIFFSKTLSKKKKKNIENPIEKSDINKCRFCDLTFQTENSEKVSMDMEHQITPVTGELLKCHRTIFVCSVTLPYRCNSYVSQVSQILDIFFCDTWLT